MNRNNLIPSVDTNDLDPKTPWDPEDENKEAKPEEIKDEPKEEKKERSLFVKGLFAVVIVVAIIALGILLPVKIVPGVSSLLTSVFNSHNNGAATTTDGTSTENAASSTVTFTSDKMSINTGDSIKLSWNGPVRNDGQYVMRYECASGVSLTLIAADGTKPAIPCSTDFRFISIDNTMTLQIDSTSQRLAEIPLSFAFVDNQGTVTRFNDVDITVINNFPGSASSTSSNGTSGDNGVTVNNNGSASSNSNTNTSTSNTSSNSGTPAPAGVPDLQAFILQTGILDKNTGAFIPTSNFTSDDRVAVRFEVTNSGTAWSGSWKWTAALPTDPTKVYQSGYEASLAPGSGVIFTLGFDNISQAQNAVLLISADSGNNVAESNESNNTASAVFSVSGGSSSSSSSHNSGDADLSLDILGVGRMNGSNFVEDDNINDYDRAAVQFKVTNIGGETSDDWRFEADMTRDNDNSDYEYRSNSQQELAPGQSTIVTVAFDNPSEGRQDFDITIDPSHDITDADRGNNSDSADIYVND